MAGHPKGSPPKAADLRGVGYDASPMRWPEAESTEDFVDIARRLQVDDAFAGSACWDYVSFRNGGLRLPRNANRCVIDSPKYRAAEHLLLEFPNRFVAVTGINAPKIRAHVESVAKEYAVGRYEDRRRLVFRCLEEYFATTIARGLDRWIADAALTQRPPDVVRKLLRMSMSPVLEDVMQHFEELEKEHAA